MGGGGREKGKRIKGNCSHWHNLWRWKMYGLEVWGVLEKIQEFYVAMLGSKRLLDIYVGCWIQKSGVQGRGISIREWNL